uniref:Laccase 4 n=1 Tax=Volvariella volvacea TaxID=36659 RepID=U5QB88_9AGAR|nr:laccase 4 [Volvariella volvacea]
MLFFSSRVKYLLGHLAVITAVVGGDVGNPGDHSGGYPGGHSEDHHGGPSGGHSGSHSDHSGSHRSFHTLKLTNGRVSPDGFQRNAVLVNGGLFQTAITGNKGDEFAIKIDNKLTNSLSHKSTSIHWHGLFQHGTPWADGPAFVSQCPIAPGHQYTYRFSSADQAGTFWYHSHLDAQYCDGLRGPFIIYDPDDPHRSLYDIDNKDTIITLADWYHRDSNLLSGIVIPNSTLINGLGRTAQSPNTPLAVVNVKQGLRYRMRLVAISCDPNWIFSIEGHKLTVIEADGVSVQPVTVTSLQIFVAQRYSFVLHANQPVGNYWIRANPNIGPTGFDSNINSAILRYKGAPIAEPRGLGLQNSDNRLREPDLHPLFNPGAPGLAHVDGADINMVINIGFIQSAGRFTIDGTSYVPPDVPTLLQILSGTPASSLLPSGSYIALPPNKVVQLSFPVFDGQGSALGGPHPIHLHGHTFDVIRSAGSSEYNFVNPPRRDVVAIGTPGDNVTIRFATDNAGPWYLHCHIEWHLRAGLGVVIAEDAPGLANGPEPPEEWKQLCPIYNALDPDDK